MDRQYVVLVDLAEEWPLVLGPFTKDEARDAHGRLDNGAQPVRAVVVELTPWSEKIPATP